MFNIKSLNILYTVDNVLPNWYSGYNPEVNTGFNVDTRLLGGVDYSSYPLSQPTQYRSTLTFNSNEKITLLLFVFFDYNLVMMIFGFTAKNRNSDHFIQNMMGHLEVCQHYARLADKDDGLIGKESLCHPLI